MTQKDAVLGAVTQVLTNNNILFTPSSTNVVPLLTRDLCLQINAVLVAEFTAGNVELSNEAKNKLSNVTDLRAYVSGLVSNWVRKDPRLNGGIVIATTSSSRSTVNNKVIKADPQLQALRKLYSSQVEPSKRQEIQSHIDRRVAELKE